MLVALACCRSALPPGMGRLSKMVDGSRHGDYHFRWDEAQ